MTSVHLPSRGSSGSAPSESSPSAVVVGAGFGGLALACRLQAAGVHVTLVERREKVGGRAYQLREEGYTFDMGPSLVTAPHILDSVFRAGGRRLWDYVDLVPLDPYYRIHFHDGSRIDYTGDRDAMRAQMARFDPRDADRLDDFMEAVEPIYGAVIEDRLGSNPFDSLRTMLGFLPRMVRMGGHRSVGSFVERYFRDPRHRFLFSFHPLFVGGHPYATPSVYLMIPYLERAGGVWFTRGGMYSLVEAMASLFTELGGIVRTGEEVEEVVVRDGRAVGVRTREVTGEGRAVGGPFPSSTPRESAPARRHVIPAELVVSNADVGHTYKDLVTPSERRKWSDRKLDSMDYGMSCFVLYLGVRRTYPELAHHTLILSERYRGLLDDIFRNRVLADDFSMYLHVPTRTDPGMAPPGCESMYVLVPVPNNRSGIDWSEVGPEFTDRILDFLEDWGLPGLRESLEVLRTFGPDEFASELNATWGNAFSLEPKLTQTAWFRPHNRSEDVDGLYLVGAGTHPGAGVPGVVLSAETTYSCIAEDFGLPPQGSESRPGRVELTEEELRQALQGSGVTG